MAYLYLYQDTEAPKFTYCPTEVFASPNYYGWGYDLVASDNFGATATCNYNRLSSFPENRELFARMPHTNERKRKEKERKGKKVRFLHLSKTDVFIKNT